MLFIQALLVLAWYDVISGCCRFKKVYSSMRGWKVTNRLPDSDTMDRVCGAVNYACAWYPKQALCLQRSFTTTYLLRRAGIAAQTVFGTQQRPFKAHAWVEVNGHAVNERSNVQARYAIWDRC
jgi:hypothetical protein